MLDYLISNQPIMWLAVAVIFGIIEGMTMGLTTIWLAGGALIAALLSFFVDSFLIQVIVWLIASILLVYFTRPIFVGKLNLGKEKTNTDAIVGTKGLVIKEIKNHDAGSVKLGGQVWTAVSGDGSEIPEGAEVTVKEIKGVKLVVEL